MMFKHIWSFFSFVNDMCFFVCQNPLSDSNSCNTNIHCICYTDAGFSDMIPYDCILIRWSNESNVWKHSINIFYHSFFFCIFSLCESWDVNWTWWRKKKWNSSPTYPKWASFILFFFFVTNFHSLFKNINVWQRSKLSLFILFGYVTKLIYQIDAGGLRGHCWKKEGQAGEKCVGEQKWNFSSPTRITLNKFYFKKKSCLLL